MSEISAGPKPADLRPCPNGSNQAGANGFGGVGCHRRMAHEPSTPTLKLLDSIPVLLMRRPMIRQAPGVIAPVCGRAKQWPCQLSSSPCKTMSWESGRVETGPQGDMYRPVSHGSVRHRRRISPKLALSRPQGRRQLPTPKSRFRQVIDRWSDPLSPKCDRIPAAGGPAPGFRL